MQISSRIYKDIMYVSLSGELDEHSSNYTRSTLDNLLENNNYNQVVVDLSELEFMDSTGIGVMIGRYNKLKEYNKPIYICNPSSQADKIFSLTNLYSIMPKIN